MWKVHIHFIFDKKFSLWIFAENFILICFLRKWSTSDFSVDKMLLYGDFYRSIPYFTVSQISVPLWGDMDFIFFTIISDLILESKLWVFFSVKKLKSDFL